MATTEQRIAQGSEHQRERAFGDLMRLVPDGELGNEDPDRIEDRIERVTIAGEDHPRGKRPRTFPAERVEALVDDDPRVRLARPGALDGFGDARSDSVRDRFCKLPLKTRCRAEMMQQVGVRPPDLRGNGLQRHGLRTLGQKQPPSGLDRGGAAFFGAESLASS